MTVNGKEDNMSQNTPAEAQIRIVGLCGSLREGSHTRMALNIALEGAQEIGVQTQLIDLREYNLVFCDGGDVYPEDVAKLQQDVKAAQGILLGIPEYHGGYSGVLKNALDLMSFDEIEGKMIGLVGVSGGVGGAANALNALRTIGRSLHAWVIPEQAAIPHARDVFDEEGQLKDVGLEQRLRGVGRQVARFAFLHTSDQAMEFLRTWEGAPANPGGETDEA